MKARLLLPAFLAATSAYAVPAAKASVAQEDGDVVQQQKVT